MADLEHALIIVGDINERLARMEPGERPILNVATSESLRASLAVTALKPLQTALYEPSETAPLLSGYYRIDALLAEETEVIPGSVRVFGIVVDTNLIEAEQRHMGVMLGAKPLKHIAELVMGPEFRFEASRPRMNLE